MSRPKLAFVLAALAVTVVAACSGGSGGGSSTTGEALAACEKSADYCGSASKKAECPEIAAEVGAGCATPLKTFIDCLVSAKATCSAAGELDDDSPGCASQKSAYSNCEEAASANDAGTRRD